MKKLVERTIAQQGLFLSSNIPLPIPPSIPNPETLVAVQVASCCSGVSIWSLGYYHTPIPLDILFIYHVTTSAVFEPK